MQSQEEPAVRMIWQFSDNYITERAWPRALREELDQLQHTYFTLDGKLQISNNTYALHGALFHDTSGNISSGSRWHLRKRNEHDELEGKSLMLSTGLPKHTYAGFMHPETAAFLLHPSRPRVHGKKTIVDQADFALPEQLAVFGVLSPVERTNTILGWSKATYQAKVNGQHSLDATIQQRIWPIMPVPTHPFYR